LGDGRARCTPADIRSSLVVMAVGCVLNAGLVLGVILLQG
jgi:hypothetical protein